MPATLAASFNSVPVRFCHISELTARQMLQMLKKMMWTQPGACKSRYGAGSHLPNTCPELVLDKRFSRSGQQ